MNPGALEAVRARLSAAAILLDFDGTLAPIVDRPQDSRPLPGAADVLTALVRRVAMVAVVTGRPASFVRETLPVPDLEVVGLYGAGGAPAVTPEVRTDVAALAARVPGAWIEDKGSTIAVHIRTALDPDAAAEQVRGPLARIAESNGMMLLEGKRVLEIAPQGGGKGSVVSVMVAAPLIRAVLYAGDDVADIEAFDLLGEPTLAKRLSVCRIAVLGSETPAELIAMADLTVDGPERLLDVLAGL